MSTRLNSWVYSVRKRQIRIRDTHFRVSGMELCVEMMGVGMEYEYTGSES